MFPFSDSNSPNQESTATQRTGAPHKASTSDQSWPSISGFEILDELGRGGMGVVYKAQQLSLKRLVALKMIRQKEFCDPEFLIRFQFEAEAIAKLSHPHIIEIYSQGAVQQPGELPSPFFVLEYLTGGDLSRHWDRSPQPPKLAAKIIEKLARAMHCAHQQGILHRDLKPANVLLTEEGEPKITDFGLVRFFDQQSGLADANSPTREGLVMGTPEYMSPEQVAGDIDLTPAVDIYALGVMLYEALTGRCPFEGLTDFDTLDQTRDQEPIPPSHFLPSTPRDVETICLKCLEKDPEKRYHSAELLADDVDRYLNGRPILARRSGLFERSWKWICRRPALTMALIMSLVAMFALVGVGVGVAYQDSLKKAATQAQQEKEKAIQATKNEAKERIRAEHLRQVSEDLFEKSKRLLYGAQMSLAARAWEEGDVVRLQELLHAHIPDQASTDADYRDVEWHLLHRLIRTERWSIPTVAHVRDLAITPDGENFYVARLGQQLKVYDTQTGKERALAKAHPVIHYAAKFSPTCRFLATQHSVNGTLTIIALPSMDTMANIPLPTTQPMQFHFSPDETKLAAILPYRDGIWIIDLTTKKITRRVEKTKQLDWINFTHDGKRLVVSDRTGTLQIRDVQKGNLLHSFSLGGMPAYGTKGPLLAISADDQRIAVAYNDHTIKIFQITGQLLQHLKEARGLHKCLAFSPDGTKIAAGGVDRCIRIWNGWNGQLLRYLRGHTGSVEQLAFTPDSSQLISKGSEKLMKCWAIHQEQEYLRFPLRLSQLHFSKDSSELFGISSTGVIRLNLKTRQSHQFISHQRGYSFSRLSMSPDEKQIAILGSTKITDSFVQVNDATGALQWSMGADDSRMASIAFSPDGKHIATADQAGSVLIWGQDGIPIKQFDSRVLNRPSALCFTPDGQKLLVNYLVNRKDGTLILWDLATEKIDKTFPVTISQGTRMILNRKGTIAYLADLKAVHGIDLRTGKEVLVCRGHSDDIVSLALSNSEQRLATASLDGTIKIWDCLTGQEILSLREHPRGAFSVAFSPDGRWLASSGHEGNALIRPIAPKE